jgi:hypothetical protein
MHAEKLNTANSSHAEMSIAIVVLARAAAPKSSTAGKGVAAVHTDTFLLHPASVNLALDETVELSVYAFPPSEGLVEDVVMCR